MKSQESGVRSQGSKFNPEFRIPNSESRNIIALGSDHAGFSLKEKIKAYLVNKGFEIKDFGTNSDESCDYPDFAFLVSDFVSKNTLNSDSRLLTPDSRLSIGILICGTGIGMSIAANRISKIRAALCHTEEFARLAREHNWANVLCLSGRFLKEGDAYKIVDTFLSSQPQERHRRRVEKLG